MLRMARPPSPQPSERHGRNPFHNLSSTGSSPTEASRDQAGDLAPTSVEPERTIGVGEGGLRPARGEQDWYRFPAPTKDDALIWRPFLDIATRKEREEEYARAGIVPPNNWKYKLIGEWRLGENLGKGTSGQVKLARSTATGQFAAVKRVFRLPEGMRHAHSIHQEISIMKLVSAHPHFVSLFDVFETPNYYFLVMEYTPLGELFNHVHQNIILPQMTQRFFSQLMSAVAYLARFRIAHRDIKLENIMLFRDEREDLSIKLIDLGMATYQPPGQLLTMSCGSPHYAAPEIMEGLPYDGIKTDIWSCGVVLYALIARTLPFDDDDIPTLIGKVRVGTYEMPASIGGYARDLVQRCLTKDPAHRIGLSALLAHPYMVQAAIETAPPVLTDLQAEDMSDKRLARRVWVGGIVANATEKGIRHWFNTTIEECGFLSDGRRSPDLEDAGIEAPQPVVSVQFVRGQDCAYVEFRNTEELEGALGLDGCVFLGGTLFVRRPEEAFWTREVEIRQTPPDVTGEPHDAATANGSTSDAAHKIFIGGLSKDLTEDEIEGVLTTYGELRSFKVARDPATRDSMGYAFCEYADPRVTDLACAELDGMQLCGMTLLISRTPPDPRPPEKELLSYLREHSSVPSTATSGPESKKSLRPRGLSEINSDAPFPTYNHGLDDYARFVDPPRAVWDPSEPLDEGLVEDVAMLVTDDDYEDAIAEIREKDSCARLFYLVLLGFKEPGLLEQEKPVQPKSAFESSGPSSGSTYASDVSTRRSSSAPTAAFPLPPTVVEEDLVLAHCRNLNKPTEFVPDDVSVEAMSRKSTSRTAKSTSPRDAPTGRTWQEINQVYVFPGPSPGVKTPEETAAEDVAAPLASAPPQIESFAFEPLPVSPEALVFAPSSHRMTGPVRSGFMYSLPSSPALLQDFDRRSVQAEKAASPPPPQRLRSKVSIQQRLRSIFSGPSVRRDIAARGVEGAERLENENDDAAITRAHRRKASVNVRWSIAETDEAPAEYKVPSPASSRRSSLLKRSDAYTSIERALAGKPPVSPALESFAALLEQGASAPPARACKLSNMLPRQRSFQVYEDLADGQESPETPRASAYKDGALASKDLVNIVDGDATKGWRLLRKASSHMAGRVRGVRQAGQFRPTSAAISTSTAATIRPTSEVPTVVVQADTPARLSSKNAIAYPWQSSTTDLAQENIDRSSRWRRSSLSIQVPAIPPTKTRISPSASPTSPAFDLCTPFTTAQAPGAQSAPNIADAPPSPPELLARSLELAQLENNHLRRTLERQEKELGLLREREVALAECLETGGKMVRELSEERDELQERLRRISWYSTGGDPAWLSPKPPSIRSHTATSGSSLESKWLGGSRKSRFEDEASS